MRGRRLVARRAVRPDGTLVLQVVGELDHDTLPELRAALRDVVAQRPPRLVVDMASVWHAAPLAGVAAFVDLSRLAHRLGVRVAIGSPPESLRRAVAETSLAPGAPLAAGRVSLPS